nr:hypothetical protein [Bacteroidia bacterium]
MHIKLLLVIILGAITTQAQVQFSQKTTDVGRINLTLSNAGTVGRPAVRSNTQGPSSMAYPQKGNEHLFESGIWIGARVDGQPLVSTSAADASSGYSTGGAGFEFTPTSEIQERSSLTSSSKYTASAVSHQDFVLEFTDRYTVVPGTSTPIGSHTLPLQANVKLETYSWNYSFADFFVICNYKITNNSTKRWDSVYVGQWSDLVVRNVNVTRQTGTNFFNKGRNGIDTKYKSIYAWLSDVSADDLDEIRSYGAIQFLGIEYRGMFFNPEKPDTFLQRGWPKPQVNYNFWNFTATSSQFTAPTGEDGRYNRMASSIDTTQLFQSAIGPF